MVHEVHHDAVCINNKHIQEALKMVLTRQYEPSVPSWKFMKTIRSPLSRSCSRSTFPSITLTHSPLKPVRLHFKKEKRDKEALKPKKRVDFSNYDDDGFLKHFGSESWFDDSESTWLSSDSTSISSFFDEYQFSGILGSHHVFDDRLVLLLSKLQKSKIVMSPTKYGDLNSESNFAPSACSNQSENISENEDWERYGVGELEPIFWPFESKFDCNLEEALEFLRMSPCKQAMGGTILDELLPVKSALINKKSDMKERPPRRQLWPSESKTEKPKNDKKAISQIYSNKRPSRLRKGSKNSAKVVPMEEEEEVRCTSLTSRNSSRLSTTRNGVAINDNVTLIASLTNQDTWREPGHDFSTPSPPIGGWLESQTSISINSLSPKSNSEPSTCSNLSQNALENEDWETRGVDETEPIFGPFEMKFNCNLEESLEFLHMSPCKQAMEGTRSDELLEVKSALINKKSDMKERPPRQQLWLPKSKTQKPKNDKKSNSKINSNKRPSRLRKGSKNSAKVVRMEEEEEESRTSLSSRNSSRLSTARLM